jgi:soluble lytic murein transglycosylase-like protein
LLVAFAMPRHPDLRRIARIRVARVARRGGAAALAVVLVVQLGQAGFRAGVAGGHGARPAEARARRATGARRARARPGLSPRFLAKLPAKLRAHPERLRLIPGFERAASATGVPAALVEAVAWQESGWQNKVVSNKGAVGIGQLRPDTVAFANALLGRSLDPTRPEHNILLSARYLAYLLGRTGGNEAWALAAYAQGFASLQRDGPHPGTVQYVADVLALRDVFVP